MHEIIALTFAPRTPPTPFSLTRIDHTRFIAMSKGPDKSFELRAKKPELTSTRILPAERTGMVEKWRRRALHQVAKLRLFRLWKLIERTVDERVPSVGEISEVAARPFSEHLAWLRRSRRL